MHLTRSNSCYHDFSSLSQDTTTQQLQELKDRFEDF